MPSGFNAILLFLSLKANFNKIGEIIQLDLWGLNEGKGRALFRLKTHIKKTVRKEIENTSLGIDSDYTDFEDVVVDTYEEWLSVGY